MSQRAVLTVAQPPPTLKPSYERATMRRNVKLFATLAVLSLALTGGALVPPSEPNEDSDTALRTTSAPMVVVDFDREIAEENGFQIREVRNTEISVPISTEARAATDAGGQPMAAGLNCGTATLIISRSIGGKIRIATAYAVQATSVYHRWNVAGSSDVGAWNEPFSGINASNTWNATHDHQFPYGTSHGFGQIKSDSYVRLWNGARCSFVGTLPSDTW